jgi:hypothetical protein
MKSVDTHFCGRVDTHYIKGRDLLKPGRVGAIACSGTTRDFSGKCASARERD